MTIHLEQEVKLRVPQRFDLRVLQPGLDGYSATPVEERRLTTIYYDTDDLRLARWGCSLRYRKGEGWTLKLPVDDGARSLQRVEHTFPTAAGKPPVEALELVTAFLRGKPVVPVARLRTTRKSLRLLGASGEDVAEVADDDVRVMRNGHVLNRFREIEVELLNGSAPSLLPELTRLLQDVGAGPVDDTPKNVRAMGEHVELESEVSSPEPTTHSSGAEVVCHALASSVERLMREDPALRLDTEPEAVHQARVATRRLRSDLRTFKPLLDPHWASGLRERIKWLADELGAVRDADVLVARLRRRAAALEPDDAKTAGRVIARFARKAGALRRRLRMTLREQRYMDLLEELVTAAARPKLLPHAAHPATSVLPELVEGRWEKLCKAIDAIEDDADDEKLHLARIKAKRCRYAAEAIAPVCGKQAARFAKRVAKLQNILGDAHDAVVVGQRLREIKGEKEEVFAAGALSALEALAANEARSSWRKAWRKASKKSLRFWNGKRA